MKPVLDVVLPVSNEAADLERSVHRLHGYLRAVSPFPFRITIGDNASADRTPLVAGRLAAEAPEVAAVHLAEKGRTACEDLRGIARLRRTIPARPLREINARLGRTESPVYTIARIGASATEVTPQV